jgi:hypothetical protein
VNVKEMGYQALDGNDLAHDIHDCLVLVNMVISFRFPYNSGNFFHI